MPQYWCPSVIGADPRWAQKHWYSVGSWWIVPQIMLFCLNLSIWCNFFCITFTTWTLGQTEFPNPATQQNTFIRSDCFWQGDSWPLSNVKTLQKWCQQGPKLINTSRIASLNDAGQSFAKQRTLISGCSWPRGQRLGFLQTAEADLILPVPSTWQNDLFYKVVVWPFSTIGEIWVVIFGRLVVTGMSIVSKHNA